MNVRPDGERPPARAQGSPTRRDVLKVGAGFTLVLTVAGALGGCGDAAAPTDGYAFLKAGDLELFSALAPAVVTELETFEPGERKKVVAQMLLNIDGACAALAQGSRSEVRKLLDLLAIHPLRVVLTGVGDWKGAGAGAMQAFLERWRSSRFATLNAGANVLVKLSASSFYMLPAAWPSAGYPGPLEYVFKAINA